MASTPHTAGRTAARPAAEPNDHAVLLLGLLTALIATLLLMPGAAK